MTQSHFTGTLKYTCVDIVTLEQLVIVWRVLSRSSQRCNIKRLFYKSVHQHVLSSTYRQC